MDHRGLKIQKIQDVENTDNGILYITSSEFKKNVISTGDTINIEWRVDHHDYDFESEMYRVYCWRRSPDDWTEDEIVDAINDVWKNLPESTTGRQITIYTYEGGLRLFHQAVQEEFKLELIDQDGNTMEPPPLGEYLERRVEEINAQAPELMKNHKQ